MNNLESLMENETHKIPWYFEVHTDHLISARQPDLVIVNKKKKKRKEKRTYRIVDFAVLADHKVKLKENEKKDKYPDLAQGTEKKYETWMWRW